LAASFRASALFFGLDTDIYNLLLPVALCVGSRDALEGTVNRNLAQAALKLGASAWSKS